MARRAATPESSVVKACLELLRLRGLLAWRSSNHGVRRRDARGREFYTFAGLKGVADITAVLPVAGYDASGAPREFGVLCGIECKAPGGRLTADQKWWMDRVREAGGLAFCVKSVGELDAALRAEGLCGGS
jgi:hypothetical protein